MQATTVCAQISLVRLRRNVYSPNINKRGGLAKVRGAVIDRPGLDLGDSGTATVETGYGSGSTEKSKGTGGGHWRVVLLNSPSHTKTRVVTAICTVIPGADENHAESCYHTAQSIGMALVTTAMKEHAEYFAQQLFRMGCRATIEPDSTVL